MPTLHIQLSDSVFAAISGVAEAHGQSVEDYVAEAAQRSAADETPVRLTPEQIEICARAEAQIDAGEFVTLEELEDRLVAHREGWIQSRRP